MYAGGDGVGAGTDGFGRGGAGGAALGISTRPAAMPPATTATLAADTAVFARVQGGGVPGP